MSRRQTDTFDCEHGYVAAGGIGLCPVCDLDTPKPVWQCECCGRFYSERTAKAHGWCQQEQDRRDAEGRFG